VPASRRDRTDDGFYLLGDPVKNLRIEHIAEVEVRTSVYTIGKAYRLPPDFEARLAEAYARQGVPRPSLV
jgi:hypothetical protein